METTENYPNEADTLTAAIDRFRARGYSANFNIKNGKIISETCGSAHDPEAMICEDHRRFEGATDPGDESAVFAIRCSEHGNQGVLVTSYGPAADPGDQDALQRLGRKH